MTQAPITHLFIAIVGAACAIGPAHAAIINVPADYGTIQGAIDVALDGDEIVVATGTYFESVDFLGKAITLRSSDPKDADVVAQTIINGNGTSHVVQCASGEPAKAVLNGFVITGGSSDKRGGGIVIVGGSSPTILNCMLVDNFAADHGGGVYVGVGASATIVDCTIAMNISENCGGGVYCAGDGSVFTRCLFSMNSAGEAGGYFGSSQAILTDCSFIENESLGSGGALTSIVGDLTIAGCTFENNSADFGGALYLWESLTTVTHCWVSGNDAVSGGGVWIRGRPNAASFGDTTICGNDPDQIVGPYSDQGGLIIADECPAECQWDLDDDGNVGTGDLILLLGSWGDPYGTADLIELLGNWGPCR